MSSVAKNTSGSQNRRTGFVLAASLSLLIGGELLWQLQPTALVLLLYVPHSFGALCGVVVGAFHPQPRVRYALLVTWVLVASLHSEAVWSVPRGWLEGKSSGVDRTRIVSLNCNVGSMKAAAEMVSLKPQLVFLQETPGEELALRLARDLWQENGASVVTPECAVLAEGKLKRLAVGPRFDWLLVEWTDLEGAVWLAASLRLAPPSSRLDVWSDEFRSEQALATDRRAESLQLLRTAIKDAQLPHHRLVIGGDFNMVAYDRTLRILEPQLVDAFTQGGVGWGDTVLNDIPFQRFDQIWVDRLASNVRCRAIKTQHSDHRLVLCDIGRR